MLRRRTFCFLPSHRDAFNGTLFLYHQRCVWVICIIYGTNTNWGLLACAPEEHNLPLDSQSEWIWLQSFHHQIDI